MCETPLIEPARAMVRRVTKKSFVPPPPDFLTPAD